jgi:hypothetical protein
VKHAPVQAVLQQTPSTLWVLALWVSAVEASPWGLPLSATQTPETWRRPDVAPEHFPLQQLLFLWQAAPTALHRVAASASRRLAVSATRAAAITSHCGPRAIPARLPAATSAGCRCR